MRDLIRPNFWHIYLPVINLFGFFLYVLWVRLCSRGKGRCAGILSMIFSFAGGAAGSVLAIALTDRKITKGNILLRIWTVCILAVQIVSVLLLRVSARGKLSFDIVGFFARHRGILIYLVIVNIVTFIIFGIDKYLAVKHRYRIKIATLLGLAFIGGSIGGLAAMYFFRHKTRKKYFTVGIPLMIAVQAAVLLDLVNVI